MRFIRSRPGLALWCAIALLILAVPLWRLRAVRQWKSPVVDIVMDTSNSQLQVGNPSDLFGLSPSRSREAARRFPDEVEAQLASLDVEPVKKQVQTIQGNFQPYYNTPQQLVATSARLRKVRPRVWRLTDNYFARYDALERRFPDSVFVRAQRLRDVMQGNLGLGEGPPPPHADKTQLEFFAGILPTEPWISLQQRNAAILSARVGARLAPDNAFFPWMEAILQFASNRPNETLRALQTAGRCLTFDDYSLSSAGRRIALLKRLQCTGWEDDFTEWATAKLPHLAKMRSLTRACVGQMRLARARQNEELAWRWAVATAGAAYIVARSNRNSAIGALVGEALCYVLWRGAIEADLRAPVYPLAAPATQPVNEFISPEERKRQMERFARDNAFLFAQIAREHGQAPLAEETRNFWQARDAQKLAVWANSSPRSLTARLQLLTRLGWLGAQVLRLCLLSALMWCAFWGFTRRWEIGRNTRQGMLLTALFGAGATGALLVGAYSVSPVLQNFIELMRDSESKPAELPFPLAVLRDNWPFLLTALWTALVFGGAVRQSARRLQGQHSALHKPFAWVRFLGWIGGIVGILTGFGFVVGNFPPQINDELLFYFLALVIVSLLLLAGVAGVRKTAGVQRVFVWCAVGTFWTTVILLILAGNVVEDATFYRQAAIVSAVALVASALGIVLQFKDFGRDLSFRTRIAAGTLALLSALAYLGIALWTIPLENRTRAMMQRQLQIGEVAWLREQIAAPK